MYDYEYESDVLGALRVLKFFQTRRPEWFKTECKCYEKLEPETLEELVWESTWDLFDDAESDFEPDYEVDSFILSDKLLDAYWESIQRRARNGDRFSEFACRELFQDTLIYFLSATSYTIGRIDCFFSCEGIHVKLWLSQDIWEPIQFANDVVTLLLYLEEVCGREEPYETERKEAA